ncbi:MAG TPA: hypothetical protein VN736_30190 [Candidatus Limnocylindrales bacterium]|jgi:uncharacterized membrane protein|nr:hypothetical protein [Candidatus Limnocylindrales bacterium]
MPFCSQCGNQVSPADTFCGRCGNRQPIAAAVPPVSTDPLAALNPRTASILCYVPALGWIAAIIVLASQKFRRDKTVRFHAFQGLYLFVAWLMADWVLRPMFLDWGSSLHLHTIVKAILLAMSVFMMVKAAQDESYSLPLFGELAERSISEN